MSTLTTAAEYTIRLAQAQQANKETTNFYVVEPVKCKVRTFWGDVMTVVLPECVSQGIARESYYEPLETVVLMQLVAPGSVFFDIGAHMGYFTLLASRLVGETGRVHAFEPTPQTYSVLGATGQNAQIIFNAERITLAEAIAKAGGLQGLRSDPAGCSSFASSRRLS